MFGSGCVSWDPSPALAAGLVPGLGCFRTFMKPVLRENLLRIEAEITAACRAAGRARTEVTLMAVSKMQPVSAIVEAEELGIRLFGENRVQEFQEKSLELMRLGHAVTGARFHFIGHLQSNKATRAAE